MGDWRFVAGRVVGGARSSFVAGTGGTRSESLLTNHQSPITNHQRLTNHQSLITTHQPPLPQLCGFSTTLMQPSSFARNVLYMFGASSSEAKWVITNDGSIAPVSISRI